MKLKIMKTEWELNENIRFSSLFAVGETSPAAKSEEKRMFSQATQTLEEAVRINRRRRRICDWQNDKKTHVESWR